MFGKRVTRHPRDNHRNGGGAENEDDNQQTDTAGVVFKFGYYFFKWKSCHTVAIKAIIAISDSVAISDKGDSVAIDDK